MENEYTSGGRWTTVPSIPSHSNSPSHSNPDFYLSPQQQQFNNQQHFQPQFQQPQQQFTPLPQFQPLQQQRFVPQQQQMQSQMQPQTQHHPSLASHFHLLPLVENLADAIENGTRDQHSDALVAELSGQFDKCQQLLNTIATSVANKNLTVEAQKQKLEESEKLLKQRRELIGKYRNSVEELTKSEP